MYKLFLFIPNFETKILTVIILYDKVYVVYGTLSKGILFLVRNYNYFQFSISCVIM